MIEYACSILPPFEEPIMPETIAPAIVPVGTALPTPESEAYVHGLGYFKAGEVRAAMIAELNRLTKRGKIKDGYGDFDSTYQKDGVCHVYGGIIHKGRESVMWHQVIRH